MEKLGVMISLMVMAVAMMGHGGYGYIVRDTDGEEVKVGGQYYVVDKAVLEELNDEIIVSYASRSPEAPCPRVAVVPNYHVSPLPHVPVSFTPQTGNWNVNVSEPVSIKFEVGYWPCLSQPTTFWTVNNRSTVTTFSEITFGGKPNTRLTNFTIESEGNGYKFAHVDYFTGIKYFIGAQSVQPSGYKRLVLLDQTKQPLVVVFKNAHKLFKRSSLLSMVPFFK